MEAIKTDKLTKKYKNLTAVDSLDLLVEQGELFALLGVNGARKNYHDQDAFLPDKANRRGRLSER